MTDAINYSLMIFTNFLKLMFEEFSFSWNNYTVTIGWVLLAGLLISMVLNSILNIPSSLPSKAYLSGNEQYRRDVKSTAYRKRVSNDAEIYNRRRNR